MKVQAEGTKAETGGNQAPNKLLWIFFAAYFTFGIVLNVVGVIIPALIKQYNLSLFAGGLLAFAFYISFGIFSIPAGWAADRIGSKPVVLSGVFLMGAGCAAIPWANGYGAIAFLAFTIGAGIALLETAGNPLIAYLDRRENYHRNLTLTIGFCGVGAFAGPFCLSALQAHGLPWQRLYSGYAALCAILLILLWAARFPESAKAANEKLRPQEMLKLLGHPIAVTYFLAIFFYVGAEVGTASWIVKFFQQMHGMGALRGTYAGENVLLRNLPALPALTVSLFWGLQGLGRLISAPGIRKLGTRSMLRPYAFCALGSLLVAMLAPAVPAAIGFASCGFFTCVLFTLIFSLACRLENDANAGAIAEHRFGAGQGTQHMVFLTMGTGLDAGIVADGRLYHGASDLAGEIGHVRLSRSGPTGHGKAGSVEGWASGGGIAVTAQREVAAAINKGIPTSMARLAANGTLTAKDVAEAARGGDKMARRIIRNTGTRLGEALAIIVDVLNPEVIVIGGLAMRLGESLLAPARRVLEDEALSVSARACRIVPVALGEEIGDIAAICVAMGFS